MTSREAFGLELRKQRERRGVTLESIERATKISRSLLVALERNDLSRWPGGLYRRSFIRDYAAAIGLPPESVLLEFARLFPEPGQPVPAAVASGEGSGFRLGLVPEPRWRGPARRTGAATIDIGVVLLAAYGVSFWGPNLWMLMAGVGLGYHAVNTICLRQSFGSWCLSSVNLFHRVPRSVSTADELAALRRDWLSQVLGGASLAELPHPTADSSLEPSA